MGREFARFFIVGIVATVIHIGIYLALNKAFLLTEESRLALTLTYAVGYVISFVFNYIISIKWTFKTSGNLSKGIGFAFSHAVNALLHILLLNLFAGLKVGHLLVWWVKSCCPGISDVVPQFSQPESLLPLPVYVIVVPVNFVMVRYFLKK